MKLHSREVLLALAVSACGAGLLGAPRWRSRAELARRAPLRCACWYWHRPFRLSRADEASLREARIERLYVYAGTLEARGGDLRLVRTQQWATAAPCAVWAVIRVHPGANAALLAPSGAARAAALLRGEPRLRTFPGIQWDADVPTARLWEYVRFLRWFRPYLAPGQALSVTALPDWLHAPAYEALCAAVDELAPQFYGNHRPKPGSRPPALWETRDLVSAVQSSARGRAQVWVGLPAYGRCVVIDAAGRPLGVRHDLDADRLLDDPAWEVQLRETREDRWRVSEPREAPGNAVPVEDTLALRCREPALAGPFDAPPGTQLWFQWPRSGGLRAAIRQLQAVAPAGVAGVCFFRWPEPGEPLAFPASAIAAAYPEAALAVSEPRLDVRLTRTGGTVAVTVRNTGSDSPLLGDDVTLAVAPPRGAAVLADGPVTWERGNELASAARGECAVFSRPMLRPDRSWEACRIENAAGPIRATVRWRGADGHWHEVTASERDRPAVSERAQYMESHR